MHPPYYPHCVFEIAYTGTYLRRVVFKTNINSFIVSLSGGPPEQAHRMQIMQSQTKAY